MTAPVAGVPGVNPVTATIPGYALQQLQAQRRLQLAQALTQQSMAPIDYDPKGHISWTQGLAKALGAFAGNSIFNDAASQEAALQTQGMQAMGAAYGMGQPPAPAAGAPSPEALGAALDPRASAALAAGAQQGSIGPTTANAALMDAMPAPAAPAAAPAAPAAPAGGAPLNPMGLPPMLLWMASQGDPAAQEQVKTLLANRTLTDVQRNSRDPLIGASTVANLLTQNMTSLQKLQQARGQVADGSPQAQQLDAAIAKENYVAPIDAKPGTPVLDPFTKKPVFFAPKVADGINLDFTNPLTPTAAAIPGYAPAAASITGADTRARNENTLTTVPDASGAQHTVWGGGQPFGGPAAAMPQSDAPPQFNLQGTPAQQISFLSNLAATDPNPTVRAAAGKRIAELAGGAAPPAAPGLGVGPGASDAAIQKSASDAIAGAPQQLATSKSAITGLETALRTLQNVPATGQGTLKTNDVIAAINNSLPASMQIRGDKNNQYQELAKYLSNSLNAAAAGTGAAGSDARFESFMHGQPNAETMSKPALDSAIRYVLSQHDAAAARAQFLPQAYQQAKAGGDPNAAMTAQSQWAQIYNPQVFAFSRMSPADRQAFKASLSPEQQAQFGAQYNAAHARGWVQ